MPRCCLFEFEVRTIRGFRVCLGKAKTLVFVSAGMPDRESLNWPGESSAYLLSLERNGSFKEFRPVFAFVKSVGDFAFSMLY